ncbi:MAG: hypothetical protein LUP99_04690 [Methanomicrobiales archaeon]|nr:hypothetical protein [Methanomicrobiales archaeon]
MIIQELIQNVREHIGLIASFRVVTIVNRLPKTRSGKILWGTMKMLVDGEPVRTPTTIGDPATLDDLREGLAVIRYPKRKFQ